MNTAVVMLGIAAVSYPIYLYGESHKVAPTARALLMRVHSKWCSQ